MDGVDAELLGRDMLPRLRESSEIVSRRLANWTVAPCPTLGWASLVYPRVEPSAAVAKLWDDVAHICRLDAADPVAAWQERLSALQRAVSRLDELALDELVFEGPGTSLRVGLLPDARWMGGPLTSAAGVVHVPNVPTEEVFTSPDPARADGVVRATKPLVTSGVVIRELVVHFAGGRVVDVEAAEGEAAFRAIAERDEGAGRLGEVALVDREGRIGPLGTVFYETLLDENAASHIAIGAGFDFVLEDERDRARVNRSEMHLDFMIGSDEVAVTGVTRDGLQVPLLREGRWQI
jgi:aminopeptidase